VHLQEIQQVNVPVAPKEQLFLQQQPHLHPLQLSFGVFHPVFLLDYPQQVVHEIPQTSGQLLVSARLVLPKQLDYSPLGSNQTTNHHSLFLVPLQVQEVLQAARTLVLRLLPQQPDSGQFVRPLQLGPPQPALGLHFPQHRSVPFPFLQLPFPSVIFGSSLMILSLFFPHVLFQVCSSLPEADPAFHLPFPRILLQHEQPLELDVLVDDAE
jgi:hypothetical protein